MKLVKVPMSSKERKKTVFSENDAVVWKEQEL